MHYTFKKNKKVFLIFKDGTKKIDRFLKYERNFFIFKELGVIKVKELRSISIYHNSEKEK